MVTDVDESFWFGGFGSFGWLLLFVGFLFSFSFFPLFFSPGFSDLCCSKSLFIFKNITKSPFIYKTELCKFGFH